MRPWTSSTICCPRSCLRMCGTREATPWSRVIKRCAPSDAPCRYIWEARSIKHHSAPTVTPAIVANTTKILTNVKGRSSNNSPCHLALPSSPTVQMTLQWLLWPSLKAWAGSLQTLLKSLPINTSIYRLSSTRVITRILRQMQINKHRMLEVSNRINHCNNKNNVKFFMCRWQVHVKIASQWRKMQPTLAKVSNNCTPMLKWKRQRIL